MAGTVRTIIDVVQRLSDLVTSKPSESKQPVVPKIGDLSSDDLAKERIRLEQEEKLLLRQVEEVEGAKRAAFEQATRESSVRQQKIFARKIKELDTKAQNIDQNLRVLSQQLRIINGFIQVKENKRMWEQSGLWATISQMDLSELQSYVNNASIEGSFNSEKFSNIVGTLEGSKGMVEGVDEDPDVMDILTAIQTAAAEREVDPAAVDRSYSQVEQDLRAKNELGL